MPTLSNAKLDTYVPRARRLLVERARARETVPYGSIQNDLGGRGFVGQVLDALNLEEHAKGRPMLSALVVNAGPNGMPSVGFFKLARRLKPASRSLSDRDLWEAERDAVYAYAYAA